MTMGLRDDFERWARLSARMLRRSPTACARLVQDEGVGHEWREADAHWYGVLTAEVGAGRLERVQRYRAICDEILAERINAGEKLPNLIELFLPDGIAQEDSTITDAMAPGAEGGPDPNVVSAALAWSLEQYSWLCAEVSESEEQASELWSARGITDPAAQAAVRRAWDQRIADDAQLEEQHRRLLTDYRRRLRSGS